MLLIVCSVISKLVGLISMILWLSVIVIKFGFFLIVIRNVGLMGMKSNI